MPIEGQTSKGKGKGKEAQVEAENLDLSGLGLGELDFSQVGDPDAAPDVPDVGGEGGPDLPWDDAAPDVPGEEDLGLDDIGVPGDDGLGILAEYLPPIRQSLETLSGQVSDYHQATKNRSESMLATLKAMADAFGQRLDALEGSVHELVAMHRAMIKGTAPAETAPKEKEAAPDGKPVKKDPPAPKKMTPAEVGDKLKITKPFALPVILSALNKMADGKELTLAQFKTWLESSKVGLSATTSAKVIDLLQLKGPITNKTFA